MGEEQTWFYPQVYSGRSNKSWGGSLWTPTIPITCVVGSIFQIRSLCPREIVILLRSFRVGTEDQVSDSLCPVCNPDLSRGFCSLWKVVRMSPSSPSHLICGIYSSSVWRWWGCFMLCRTEGPSVEITHGMKGKSPHLFMKAKITLGCRWGVLTFSPAQPSGTFLIFNFCPCVWNLLIWISAQGHIPGGIRLCHLISPVGRSSPGAAGGKTTWGPGLWRAR